MFTTLISASELNELPQCRVFDCRFNLADEDYGRRMFAASHIPGAVYLDLNRDLSSPISAGSGRHPLPDPARLHALLRAHGLQPGMQAVVYDDAGGATAARAWWLLRWLGHSQVAVLDGGIQAWEAAAYALESGSAAMPLLKDQEPVHTDATASVDTVAVQAALHKPDFLLIDARASERFRGETEPLDPVAGHVPGALNRPLQENLRQGLFKPADELRREWLQLLAGRDPATVVHMCGSGVTACHNQLAMETAGLAGSRVYTGSWSEWIRDPERPVATGAE